jgi:hypothetical protein
LSSVELVYDIPNLSPQRMRRVDDGQIDRRMDGRTERKLSRQTVEAERIFHWLFDHFFVQQGFPLIPAGLTPCISHSEEAPQITFVTFTSHQLNSS